MYQVRAYMWASVYHAYVYQVHGRAWMHGVSCVVYRVRMGIVLQFEFQVR